MQTTTETEHDEAAGAAPGATLRAGVFGASGYAGRELVRLLRRHPRVRLAFTTGSGDGHLAHEAGLERPADAYFLALPHGVSAGYAARLRAAHPHAVVIDLSGDLRLPTADAYKDWYGHDHPAPELLAGTPYGLAEIYRERLRGARLVANPGCYATAVLLPLVPLLRERLVEADDVLVDAKSGASGAGRTLREDLLFCELQDDFWAYSPGRSHRHVGEMEAVLRERTGRDIALAFCPHLLPVKRGILASLYLRTPHAPEELAAALRAFYARAPFVIVEDGRLPRLSDVQHTNDCRIAVHAAAPGRVVVFAALDNLVKGAAGQAVQNFNLALGFDERLGLWGTKTRDGDLEGTGARIRGGCGGSARAIEAGEERRPEDAPPAMKTRDGDPAGTGARLRGGCGGSARAIEAGEERRPEDAPPAMTP